MSPKRLQEVKTCINDPAKAAQPSSAKGTFIGLKNISQRLKLFYREQAQLTIHSKEHQGTTVTIRIPVDTPSPVTDSAHCQARNGQDT